ncbi:MAG: hypothetical protein P8008_05795 [Gammaproteobacteria bacterium]
MAWAYELTPEGLKRDTDVSAETSGTRSSGNGLNILIITLMALAIAVLLYDRFAGVSPSAEREPETAQADASLTSPANEDAAPDEPEPPGPEIPSASVAVLPVDNRSGQAEDAFFVEGIHDDLLTNLARIGSLKVISRTSVEHYANSGLPIPDIARELGVAAVMEGAVQRAGGTVRINVQLIDAKTDEHLWAERYDRELSVENLFDIQSEIAERIANALQATLSPQLRQTIGTRPTDNLAAYDAYLLGRQLYSRHTRDGYEGAIEAFERAVSLDPEFALAWASLPLALFTASNNEGLLSAREAAERGEAALERALALDPDLPRAWSAKANWNSLMRPELADEEIEAQFQKALELAPNDAGVRNGYGAHLARFPTRLGEALRQIDVAIALDPVSKSHRLARAWVLINAGRFEEADKELQSDFGTDPENDTRHPSYLASILNMQTGDFDRAIRHERRALSQQPDGLLFLSQLISLHLDIGAPELAEPLHDRLVEIGSKSGHVGGTKLFLAVYDGDLSGALEHARQFYETSGGLWRDSFSRRMSDVLAMNDRFEEARDVLLDAHPDFEDPARWPVVIARHNETACRMGFLLLRTGEPERGERLLKQTLQFLTEELPKHTPHADASGLPYCQAALGDRDAALTTIETWVDHGHISQWWWWRHAAEFRDLRDHPRFVAAMARIQDNIAAQRESLFGAGESEPGATSPP